MSKDGNSATSLGNLYQCSVIPTLRNMSITEERRRITSLHLLAISCPMQPRVPLPAFAARVHCCLRFNLVSSKTLGPFYIRSDHPCLKTGTGLWQQPVSSLSENGESFFPLPQSAVQLGCYAALSRPEDLCRCREWCY